MRSTYSGQENELGISTYVCQAKISFAAVLKARYSDFVVHEVDAHGNIARLESLENNLQREQEAQPSQIHITNHTEKEEGQSCGTVVANTEDSKNDDDCGLNDVTEGMNNKHNEITNATKRPIEFLTDNKSKQLKLSTDNNDFQLIQSQLTPLVGSASSHVITSHLSDWEYYNPTSSSQPIDKSSKYVSLPPMHDKRNRKNIHMLIKSQLFKRYAVADTVDRCVRIWHRRFERYMPNYGLYGFHSHHYHTKNRKEVNYWPKDRPDYLQFVLYKENMDTTTAIKDISKLARLLPSHKNRRYKGSFLSAKGSSVGYAGMKDKRGVTSQFCTVYRKTPEDMLVINRHKDDGGGGNSSKDGTGLLRVGHFKYVKDELLMGQLGGNRFDVVLRNISVDSNTNDQNTNTKDRLQTAVTHFEKTGFINYFGMQRFGRYRDTHTIGKSVLQGNFQAAINSILGIKSPDHDNDDSRNNARERWKNRFVGIDENDTMKRRDAEIDCVKSIQHQFGRFGHVESSILGGLSRRPCDYKWAFLCVGRGMRCMFLHAYQSYLWNMAVSYRMDCSKSLIVGDLVLMKDKGGVESESGTSGLKGKRVHIVTEKDIEANTYGMEDVVLPLVGSKILYPMHNTGKLFDKMLNDDMLTKKTFETIKEKELTLGGDYRKIVCRPKNVKSDIKTYWDPLLPLLRTDLMVVKGVELEYDNYRELNEKDTGKSVELKENIARSVMLEDVAMLGECMDDNKYNGEPKENVDDSVLKDSRSHNHCPHLIGMVISFTLPPSAYATIALRELMRRPTSSEYQAELMLDGKCERNVGKGMNRVKKKGRMSDDNITEEKGMTTVAGSTLV